MLECHPPWGTTGPDPEPEPNWLHIRPVGLDDLASLGSVYLPIYLGGGL